MRIVYAGYNFFSSCLVNLLRDDDHEVVLALTGRLSESVDHIVALCERSQIPVISGRPGSAHVLDRISDAKPDLVVCAAYSYRFPIEELDGVPGLNVHPSMLPIGRGPNPLPTIVSDCRSAAGVTVHLMDSTFDTGPILAQEPIELDDFDGFHEYALRLYAVAPLVLRRAIHKLQRGDEPEDQIDGSYWQDITDSSRTLDAASATALEVQSLYRTVGPLGLRLTVESDRVLEFGILTAVVKTAHAFAPGAEVSRTSDSSVVALRDGLAKGLRIDPSRLST